MVGLHIQQALAQEQLLQVQITDAFLHARIQLGFT
jgi:hypothetical protein